MVSADDLNFAQPQPAANIVQFPSRNPRPRRLGESANQNHPLKWNIHPFMPRPFLSAPPSGGAAPALCRLILALLHLTVVATANAAHQTLAIPVPVSRPYLATASGPALRFMEARQVSPLPQKPIASGPPVAASAQEQAAVNLANHEAAASTPPMPTEAAESSQKDHAATPTNAQEPTPAPATKPKPILPDDTRRKVQSQDFLPLFRFPGTNAVNEDVTVIVPVPPAPPSPGTLPPSSATYQQH
jgi:hypothetical protein